MTNSVIKRLRNRPKPRTHKEKVEQAIDRLMLVELWLYWYIAELEDLKEQLSKDVVLILLVPIVEVMIAQLWQLMRRWAKAKAEVIREAKKGLMRMKEWIYGNGFTIEVNYNKYVIDLKISLHDGNGDYAEVPDLGIDENVLKVIRAGWRASDSSHNYDNPAMRTNFAWQALSWLLAMPGAEVWIYARGISVAKDGVKPMWDLQINGFEVEWSSAKEAYEEMARLPRELFAVSVLHAMFGDGSSDADNGARNIQLTNSDHEVLELVKTKLENEFKVKGTIGLVKRGWRYAITGSGAKDIAEIFISTLEALASVAKRLYDMMASEKYEIIQFMKWAAINRASRYILNESKVRFVGLLWTPSFTYGSIYLKIKTRDAEMAEELRRKAEVQGIDVVIKKYANNYEVRIVWSVLKKYLCNTKLREQLIRSAMKSVENCRIQNMVKGRKKDCDEIPAIQWLQHLTDPQWLRENIGCGE